MARLRALLFTSAVGIVGLSMGCQQDAGMSSQLPPPNFNGPIVAPVKPVAPPPMVALTPKAPILPNKTYAMSGERAWIPNAPARDWKWIVIHHSASPSGSAAVFDKEHKAKGWDELGYHFVIGNGTDSGNGQIEVGSRWPKQKWGAHAKTPDNRFNDTGIGICLVGNFDIERPTSAQLASVAKLVAYLQSTYHISSDHIVGHGMVHNLAGGGTVTDCPGKHLNLAAIRQSAAQKLAAAGAEVPSDDPSMVADANTELLQDDKAAH